MLIDQLMLVDDPEAVLASSPTRPPAFRRSPLFEVSFKLENVDPALVDLLVWGQSPGPHITLGEN